MRIFPAAVALFGLVAVTAPVHAESPADFYKGKTITWVLSAGAGGGYASYANAFAEYFSDHIPGKPTIAIQNMPGAGGIKAMNFLYSVAPKDGTTIGLVHSSVPFAPIYGIKGAKFDPRKMNWIGSIATANAICVAWHSAHVDGWKDLFEGKLIVGTSGAGSQMETLPLMLNRLFGTNIKIIPGYKGGNDVYLAMERGEVNGRCGGLVSSIRSTRPDWFPEKKITVPISLTLKRTKTFPDTPAVGEFVKDEKTKQALSLIFAPQDMDRPILAPPGVPADRLAALRQAFHETMNDPRFQAEAKKQHLDIDEVSGAEVAKVIADAFDLPPDVVALAKEAVQTGSKAKSESKSEAKDKAN